MQLKDSSSPAQDVSSPSGTGSIASQLALATTALLGQYAVQAAENWQADTGVLIYQESEGRVTAVEPVIELSKQLNEDDKVNIRLVYDALTGASPNGAMAANRPQTFTSPSGGAGGDDDEGFSILDSDEDDDGEGGNYLVAAGETPLDPSFQDTRFVAAASWSGRLPAGWLGTEGKDWLGSISAGYSGESDFSSFNLNGALAREFNRKNTTLSLGFNLEWDHIVPHGGVPVELGRYIEHPTQGSETSKTVKDLMLSLTQVFHRRWLSRFNLGLSDSSGYQADPYKILTVADQGNLMVDSTDASSYLYVFEKRPQQRRKWIGFWQNRIALFQDDALDVSLRHMSDDWGIQSRTLDLSYYWQLDGGWYLQPHWRRYRQTAADFYTPFLAAGTDIEVNGDSLNPLLDYASADARLGAFSATTVGLKLGYRFSDSREASLKFEQYRQFDENPLKSVAAGSDLDGMDQFAETSAWWLQARYTMKW